MNYYMTIIATVIMFKHIITTDYYDDYYEETEAATTYMCGVSKEERETIIDLHNRFRLLIANGTVEGQPRGVNLKRIKWDIRLAEQSQYLASRAKYDIRVEPDDRFIFHATSQSVYLLMSTANLTWHNWTKCLYAWFEEHHNYVFGSQDRAPLVYHYKQIVWANTSFVGCGACSYYDNFSSNTRPNFPYKTLMACNYGPPSNLCDYNGTLFDPYITNKTEDEEGCLNLCPSDELETDFLVEEDYFEQKARL